MRGAAVWAVAWCRSKVGEFLRCPKSFDFLRALAQLAARNCHRDELSHLAQEN